MLGTTIGWLWKSLVVLAWIVGAPTLLSVLILPLAFLGFLFSDPFEYFLIICLLVLPLLLGTLGSWIAYRLPLPDQALIILGSLVWLTGVVFTAVIFLAPGAFVYGLGFGKALRLRLLPGFKGSPADRQSRRLWSWMNTPTPRKMSS